MTTVKTSTTRSTGVHRRWSRRGISLIEVIMASVLLTVIASAVVGGITTVVTADSRNQQRLESLELANRLLLQYVDDQDAMPSEATHITQGQGVYRWTIRTSPVVLTMPQASVIDKPVAGAGANTIDKVRFLAVSVYAGVPDGMGGYAYGERVCTLTRMHHPLSIIYRNPNKLASIAGDPEALIRIFGGIIDAAPSTGNAAPSLSGSVAPKPAGPGEFFTGAHSNTNRPQ